MPRKKKELPSTYKSGVFDLGGAVTFANQADNEGYYVAFCVPVIAKDQNLQDVQAIYLLAKRKEEERIAVI